MAKLRQYDELIDCFTSFDFLETGRRVHSDFIRALLLAECHPGPDAVSVRDAIGLGQICIDPGRKAGRKLWIHGIQFSSSHIDKRQHLASNDRFDPALNILSPAI